MNNAGVHFSGGKSISNGKGSKSKRILNGLFIAGIDKHIIINNRAGRIIARMGNSIRTELAKMLHETIHGDLVIRIKDNRG